MKTRRRSAGSYHEAMTLCPNARKAEFLAPLQLALPAKGERLVDFPSGGGYLKGWLERIEPDTHYHAVEQIKGYLDTGTDIEQGDWDHLEFPDTSVDIVLSLVALHHLFPDRSPFYKECHRILNHTGRLVIADVAEKTDTSRFLSGFVGTHSPEGHDARFFAEEDCEEIRNNGFEVMHYEIQHLPWHYPDRETAIAFCRGLFRLYGVRDELIWEALENYLGIIITGSGITMKWQLVLIRADKNA
ncbi:class I SAM-dependent methyltransferase [Solemya elarraichensis gill symbiont]|uniref:Methyltransferase type 11 domain-containing protein n=1 Tax=Solemya elarraichensis gill symbiont TaxID=1918949 RepID=A0A1T2KVV5_9GAMM|nr:methyltransferase domain-containing protein [Solemya elarraichensis gill symbiont]OOZ36870.1 hypothetical protein BOW52_10505 [Solemya elarraichensis gill symbiont]